MKTKEELNEIKEEVENLNKKLAELTDEELRQVAGGLGFPGEVPAPHIKDDFINRHGLYCPVCNHYIGTAVMVVPFLICPACKNQIIPELR